MFTRAPLVRVVWPAAARLVAGCPVSHKCHGTVRGNGVAEGSDRRKGSSTEQTSYVTKTREIEGVHVVHSGECQALPKIDLEELGTFKDCAPAVEAARRRFATFIARALCRPTCYMKAGGDAAA